MNRARELLIKNNKQEEAILSENAQIYTNMVVYLRGSDLSDYNQEIIRKDIIEMILDGQERGDSIEKVMGNNYKQICDEIIAVMPKITGTVKMLKFCEIALSSLAVLGLIRLGEIFLDATTGNNSGFMFTLTVGNLLQAILIIGVAYLIVNDITKNSFGSKNNKRYAVKITFFFALILLVRIYFKVVVLKIAFWLALLSVFCLMLIAKLINHKLSSVN
ncbi:hypothetical protein Q5O14_04610 [Eubacteriaceae bacterium ES2]|nr:hypothetical protein Q5O14_04610 [Eubacteriaceae bacterium ES2]